mmetsp:Transcript_36960/g.91958  ORF Transcript_36960/g.91958 Transcript_36960/m.91958 type:complete len:126 (-) Transcript_36960:291-668(-)
MSAANPAGPTSVPLVDIDDGTFKYVLIEARPRGGGEATLFVRGHSSCEYHADVLERTEREPAVQAANLSLRVLGGGRMKHDAQRRTLFIYGYSQQYGQADHALAMRACEAHLGEGYEITTSNEGY